MKKFLSFLVLLSLCFGVYRAGQENALSSLFTPVPQQSLDYRVSDTVWSLVESYYLKSNDLDREALKYGVAKGLVQALDDPYSSYMTPDESIAFMTSLNGELEGIGAELRLDNGAVRVVAPLPGSPAEQSGILPGDIIVKVDGEPLGNVEDLMSVVIQIRGPKGSEVVLTVLHEERFETEDITIVRDAIELEALAYEILEHQGESIPLITFSSFTEDSADEFLTDVKRVLGEGYNKVIIDLRFNGGGYLDAAVDVVSLFVDPGMPVVHIRGKEESSVRTSYDLGTTFEGEVVILVNEASASASEIVAGALQDYELATIVGQKTFGKGSVQEVHPLRDQSLLRITIAEWLTPLERTINHVGIEPDVLVELDYDKYLDGEDTQLNKALEILSLRD